MDPFSVARPLRSVGVETTKSGGRVSDDCELGDDEAVR